MAEMTRAEAAALLGVPENADKAAVNAAVRKLTSKYHPDAVRNKSPEEQKEAERIFKSLNKAKKVMFEPPKPEQPAAAPTSTFASSAGMAGGGYAGSSQNYQQGRVPRASTNARVNTQGRSGAFEQARSNQRHNYNTARSFNFNIPHVVDDEEYTLQQMYQAEATKRYKKASDVFKVTPSIFASVIFLIYAIYKLATGILGSMTTGIPFDIIPYLILVAIVIVKFFIYDLLISHHLMSALSKAMSKISVMGVEVLLLGCGAIALSLPKPDVIAVGLAFLGLLLVGTGFIIKMVRMASEKRKEEEIPEM